MLNYDFTGKTTIVTGGARGVGREIVHQLAAAGGNVVAVDRDRDGLNETCSRNHDSTKAIVADIRDPTQVRQAVTAAINAFGDLHGCINNAAVAPHAALLDETPQTWDIVHEVNGRGTFLMTQAVARKMLESATPGRILNFSSGVTKRGSAGAAAYASSRAAVEALTKVAAIELAPHGILVNCIRPGLIDTQPKPLPPAMAASLTARIPNLPLARPGTVTEVANLALWLMSEECGYMTGAIIDIDGGAGLGGRWSGTVVDDDPRYFWTK